MSTPWVAKNRGGLNELVTTLQTWASTIPGLHNTVGRAHSISSVLSVSVTTLSASKGFIAVQPLQYEQGYYPTLHHHDGNGNTS